MNELAALKGIGPKIIEKLNTLGIYNTNDLLEYYPRTYVDKTGISHISDIAEGEYFSLKGILYNITSKQLPYGRRLHIVTAEFKDQTGQITITWFNQPYLKNVLKENKMIYLYGKVEKKGFFYNMYNPDFSYNEKEFFIIQPIYSKNAKINQYEIRKAVKSAMDYSHVLVKDYFPEYLKERYSLCDKEFAVRNIHFPASSADFFAARRRLVFEEFFLMQLALVSLKSNIGKDKSPINISKFDMAGEFVRSLPFTPTDAQLQSMKDIASDLSSGYSMHRLLQGDVGSGKTVVALYAVMCAYQNGYQSAFMAPTEILALQHYRTAVELLSKFGLNIVLLTGQLRKKEREDILNRIENGLVHLVIGTHAILQEDVIFHNLALCITDEQHRFGVQQRLILSSKGLKPHLLVMSATPIPRTLALILYGDLDISTLKELPKNRKKVLTYSVDESFRQRINNFIQKIVSKGEQVFVVCPAIYENDVLDVTNVLTKYEQLQIDIPSVKSAVLHGKMKKAEKNEVMEKFINYEISVLVTTSIIEVGIDIPNATLMIIEDAQQFGLSQLHQLRGRVGRSDKQSYCILFNQSSSDISKKRMDVMVQSNDGFYISEQDLLLRGPGDFFGTKQHGLPDFKIANLYTDMDILKDAQKAVQEEIRNNAAYRQLLGRELDYLSKAKL